MLKNGGKVMSETQLKDEENGPLQTNFQSKQVIQSFPRKSALLLDKLTITKGKKTIVNSISFEANFGEITAIMGPSGSGKTSVLRYLANIRSSNLTYSGKKVLLGALKYVGQEDHLHGFYTVDEYINNQFGLNYGFVEWGFEQRDILKTKIISELQLTKAQNTKVGDIFIQGLSGGEKRRLSVALELVSKPSVLILDEPTSGLDSFAAEKVIETLRNLVMNENICVMLTIHQPSSKIFKMIHNIALLKEGQLMFFGPPDQVGLFLSINGQNEKPHYNPADQCLEILSEDSQIKSSEYMPCITLAEMNKIASDHSQNNVRYHKQANFLEKFLFLTLRNFKNLFMNPLVLIVRVVMYIMLTFMVGAMFWNVGGRYNEESVIARASVLFYVDAFLVFMSIAAVPAFMMERAIVEKELRNKLYHPWTFQMSNWFTSWFGVILIAIVSSLFVVFMCNLNRFGIFLVNLFLSLMIAEGLAFLVALIVPHYIIAMALIAGLYGMFMICCGFFIVYNDIPAWFIWGYYMAFHSYSFRIFMFNEFNDIGSLVNANFQNGKEVLEFYSMGDVNVGNNLVILLGYILGLQIVTAIIMKLKY